MLVVQGLTSSLYFSYNIVMLVAQPLFEKKLSFFFADTFPELRGVFFEDLPDVNDFFKGALSNVCKCGVPNRFRIDPHPERPPRCSFYSAKNRLQKYKDWLSKNNWTDEQRKAGLRVLASKTRKVMARVDGGAWRIFDGRQKGTTAYNRFYRSRIIDRCMKYVKAEAEILALTVTCSVKEVGNDRVLAWGQYRGRVSRLLKEIRRAFGGGYVSVLESTKKGFPHAHIILALPKGSVAGYSKMKNRSKIYYGKIVNVIQKFKPAQQFRLEKISGKNTAFYLTKYISKFETNNFFALGDSKDDLSVEERKAVDCLLFTTLTGARQFTLSQESASEQKLYKKELFGDCEVFHATRDLSGNGKVAISNSTTSAPPDPDPIPAGDFSAKRFFLIRRCINLPSCCRDRVYTMSLQRFRGLFGGGSDRDIESSYQNIQTFMKMGDSFSCQGCIYSHLYRFIMGFDDYLLNPWVQTGDGYLFRYFDECDMNDDEEFLRYLCGILWYIGYCVNNNLCNLAEFARAGHYDKGIDLSRKDPFYCLSHDDYDPLLEKEKYCPRRY